MRILVSIKYGCLVMAGLLMGNGLAMAQGRRIVKEETVKTSPVAKILLEWKLFLEKHFSDYPAVIENSHYVLIGLVSLVVLIIILVIYLSVRSRPVSTKKVASPKEAQKAAKVAQKAGNFLRAGELWEAADKPQKAIEAYSRGRAFTKAADVYTKTLSQPEKALELLLKNELFDPAGRVYASIDRHAEAAECYMRVMKKNLAAEHYEKAGNFARAGELYAEQDNNKKAALCFERAKVFPHAARHYELWYREFKQAVANKTGEKEKAQLAELAKKSALFYKQSGDFKKAAQVCSDAGMNAPAAELYAAGGDFVKAAEHYHFARNLKKAAEYYHKSGDKKQAAGLMAEVCQSEGKPLEAARYLAIAGEFLAAADIFAGEGQFEKAADLYTRGGDSRAASEMYLAAGKADQAMDVFEKTGDHDSAVRLLEETGREDLLAEVYEKKGRFFEAASSYYDQGQLEKAEDFFGRVSPDHPRYGEAMGKSGAILIQRGNFEKALNRLQLMAQRMPLTPLSMDYYYLLALAYEQQEHLMYAATIYQQLMAYNYQYKDVAMRFSALSQRLMRESQAYASTQGGGRMVGERYKPIKELGRGGMGVVYLAEDQHLGRKVAIKVLPEELRADRQMVDFFIREARSLAQMSHPYIVNIFDAGEEQNVYYIIMEYVIGKDLKEMLAGNRRLPLAAGVQVFSQLAQALDYAHDLKVIHRDIKPANIMWTQQKIIKIMDFGLATVMDKVREGMNIVAGTPYYMSPEQTLGKNVDHRTDIYAMGVTMYELLTGQVPFKEGDIGYHHLHTPPTPPGKLNAQITPEVERIILKCMAKDLNQRYQRAGEVVEQLNMMNAQARSQA